MNQIKYPVNRIPFQTCCAFSFFYSPVLSTNYFPWLSSHSDGRFYPRSTWICFSAVLTLMFSFTEGQINHTECRKEVSVQICYQRTTVVHALSYTERYLFIYAFIYECMHLLIFSHSIYVCMYVHFLSKETHTAFYVCMHLCIHSFIHSYIHLGDFLSKETHIA